MMKYIVFSGKPKVLPNFASTSSLIYYLCPRCTCVHTISYEEKNMRLYYASFMGIKKQAGIEDSIEHSPALYFANTEEEAMQRGEHLCQEHFPKTQGYIVHHTTIGVLDMEGARLVIQILQKLFQEREYTLELDASIKKQMRWYFVSVMATQKHTKMKEHIAHCPTMYFSRTREEAIKQGCAFCKEAFPLADGYSGHTITIDALSPEVAQNALQRLLALFQTEQYK